MHKTPLGPAAVYAEPRMAGVAPESMETPCLADRLGDGVAILVALVVLLATVQWTMRLPPL